MKLSVNDCWLTLNYTYKYVYLVHWSTYTIWYFLSASIIVCDQQLWAIFTHHKNTTELLIHWLYGPYTATLKKSVREAFTRFSSLLWTSFIFFTGLAIRSSISLAKTMKLNIEYPTKDWLKTSQNARPLDIIREKTIDQLQFCFYKMKHYNKELHV